MKTTVDLEADSEFPEINAQRAKLRTQMDRLEKAGEQDSRKYKRAEKVLKRLQVMNFVPASGYGMFDAAEFGKTASLDTPLTIEDAYLAGYQLS